MANQADVVLRIYGDNADTISNKILELKNDEVSIEELVTSIRDSFKDPDDLKVIDEFLKNGDKRFSFTISDGYGGYLELEGQSAWCEPYESINVLEHLYDVKIYYLVYESSNDIYETNDMEGDVFGDDFKYALDSNNHYGRVDESTLVDEAEKYYESDFFDVDDVFDTTINGSDPHEDDMCTYFYLLKLERVEQ